MTGKEPPGTGPALAKCDASLTAAGRATMPLRARQPSNGIQRPNADQGLHEEFLKLEQRTKAVSGIALLEEFFCEL
jgi:hypothetical protein